MTRTLLVVALLFLSACDRQEPPAAPAPKASAARDPAVAPKAAVPSLTGQWRVTGQAGVDLTIGDGKATVSSGCVRRGFTYQQERNSIAFASSPAGSANCGSTPSGAVENAAATLADANLAVFGEGGRTVTLSGLGGMLALERR